MPVVLSPERIVALAKGHDRAAFDCGNDDLNRYLKQQARQDADRRVAAPFVLLEADAQVVRGFYCLSASLIGVEELPENMLRRLPRYGQLPVTLLGRLAVDRTLQGKGAGELLLMDALWRSLAAARHIGAMAVVVDAKDPQAESFYGHFGFMPYQLTPLRLFLPMGQIERLFPAV